MRALLKCLWVVLGKDCVAAMESCVFRRVASAARFFYFSEEGVTMEYRVVRKIDKTGRLVIPNDLRKLFGMSPDTAVVIIPTEDGILLKCVKEDERND